MHDLNSKLPDISDKGRYWLAFSGGLDSTVLLHWMSRQAGQPLTAVHINHQLQEDSDHWAEQCRACCAAMEVDFRQIDITVEDVAALGLEAAARKARYQALGELLGPEDVLLTAHHRDDQAETLLLQLLRGAGPHGLAAMPTEALLQKGRHSRPLLSVPREDIEAYASHHQLKWIEDPSNSDTQIRRNYLRREVLPLVSKHWPQYNQSLERSAGLQAEAAELLDTLAAIDLLESRGMMPDSLSVSALLALPVAQRRNVIRYWLRNQDFPMPNQAHMLRIESDLLSAREDAMPCVNWAQISLYRYRDDLVAMHSPAPAPAGKILEWNLTQTLKLPEGCGELVAERARGAGLALEKPLLEVRFGQKGERMRPLFSNKNRTLKNIFQEGGVPPWVRERLPLIYHGPDLAAVADRWIAAEYAAQGQEQGWLLHWRNPPVGWLAPDTLSET